MQKEMILENICNILSGQILTRLAPGEFDDGIKVRVIKPKAICSNGSIALEECDEETVKSNYRDKSDPTARSGDIIIKCAEPYEAGILNKKLNEKEEFIVPSFCVIVRLKPEYYNNIDPYFLLAFLNSSLAREQYNVTTSRLVPMITVAKIKKIKIPAVDIYRQKEIGNFFLERAKRIDIMKEIIQKETELNDAIFEEIGDEQAK